jgi:hypothetical protein
MVYYATFRGLQEITLVSLFASIYHSLSEIKKPLLITGNISFPAGSQPAEALVE